MKKQTSYTTRHAQYASPVDITAAALAHSAGIPESRLNSICATCLNYAAAAALAAKEMKLFERTRRKN
jgi:hypothetical protein